MSKVTHASLPMLVNMLHQTLVIANLNGLDPDAPKWSANGFFIQFTLFRRLQLKTRAWKSKVKRPGEFGSNLESWRP